LQKIHAAHTATSKAVACLEHAVPVVLAELQVATADVITADAIPVTTAAADLAEPVGHNGLLARSTRTDANNAFGHVFADNWLELKGASMDHAARPRVTHVPRTLRPHVLHVIKTAVPHVEPPLFKLRQTVAAVRRKVHQTTTASSVTTQQQPSNSSNKNEPPTKKPPPA
jgi:hypothetical protein